MLKGYGDSRLLLLALAAEGVEMTGSALVRLGKRLSPQGRMSQRLRDLETSGHLARSGAGRIDQRVFRLTDSGQSKAFGVVNPILRWRRKWDGLWRLVMFDIPEQKNALRTKLRRRLQEAHFGWLQNSVWISPDLPEKIHATIKATSISASSLTVLEARPIGGESDPDLVQAAWDFPRLANDYQAYRKLLREHPAATAGLKSWLPWIAMERAAWKKIAARDPFLPECLLPSSYPGREAWSERTRALEILGATLRREAEAG